MNIVLLTLFSLFCLLTLVSCQRHAVGLWCPHDVAFSLWGCLLHVVHCFSSANSKQQLTPVVLRSGSIQITVSLHSGFRRTHTRTTQDYSLVVCITDYSRRQLILTNLQIVNTYVHNIPPTTNAT